MQETLLLPIQRYPMRYPLTAFLLALPLAAQKLPDPTDNAREIQVYRLAPFFDAIEKGEAPERTDEGLPHRPRAVDVRDCVRSLLEPEPAADAVQVLGPDLLVVRGTPQQQVAVAAMFAELETRALDLCDVHCRFLRVQDKAAQGLLVGIFAGVLESSPGVYILALEEGKATTLCRDLLANEGGNEVEAPALRVWPTARSSMSFLSNTTFTRAFEPVVIAGETVAVPVRDAVRSGVALDVRVCPMPENRWGLAFNAVHMDFPRPIPKKEIEVRGVVGKHVIEVPQMDTRKVSGVLLLSPGTHALFLQYQEGRPDHTLMILSAGSRP